MQKIPVVVTSSDVTSKFDITSASIASISVSLRADVTVAVTLKLATIPVIEGTLDGMLVVGAGIGWIVGRAVTTAAQNERIRNIRIP